MQRNQKQLNYQDFTAVFVKMCKIRKHGGFLQSRSHNYIVFKRHQNATVNYLAISKSL